MAVVIVCRQCGQHNSDGDEFCPSCGSYLPWEGERLEIADPEEEPAGLGGPTGTQAGGQSVRPDAEPPPHVRLAPEPRAPVPTPRPGEVVCEKCLTPNAPGHRFCRKCGAEVGTVAEPAVPLTPPRPWWRRIWRSDGTSNRVTRAARSQYRRSLGVRYRVLRVLGVLTGLGLVLAGLGVAGADPVGWARERWDDIRPDEYSAIEDVTASVDPPGTEVPDYAPEYAVDGIPERAWAALWESAPLPPGQVAAPECDGAGTGMASAALVVNLPGPVDLSRLEVRAGLSEDDGNRLSQWRPRALQLEYSDGTCQRVTLEDDPAAQTVDIEAEQVTAVEVVIVDAFGPEVGEDNRAALTDLVFFTSS